MPQIMPVFTGTRQRLVNRTEVKLTHYPALDSICRSGTLLPPHQQAGFIDVAHFQARLGRSNRNHAVHSQHGSLYGLWGRQPGERPSSHESEPGTNRCVARWCGSASAFTPIRYRQCRAKRSGGLGSTNHNDGGNLVGSYRRKTYPQISVRSTTFISQRQE